MSHEVQVDFRGVYRVLKITFTLKFVFRLDIMRNQQGGYHNREMNNKSIEYDSHLLFHWPTKYKKEKENSFNLNWTLTKKSAK